MPTTVISITYDNSLSETANGSALASAVNALSPGQELEIGSGTWSIDLWFNISVVGTAGDPIWIVASPGATPVLTRPDANQNVLNIGATSHVEYVCLRGLEVTGGSDLIKLYDVSNVWIDQCYIHHGDDVGIAANSHDTDHLYLTRNTIVQPGGTGPSGLNETGEGMYLGANNAVSICSNSVIALNTIHHTAGYLGSQGSGIQLKQGSYGNWIVQNVVHDTQGPCILGYGTGGLGFNTVERNICYTSQDNVLQWGGEAIIRNNLFMNGYAGFEGKNDQGSTVNMTFVHNTIINSGRATHLSTWNGSSGMVFANNAIYSQNGESIDFPNGSAGVAISGNVVLGSVVGTSGGSVAGTGLGDFVNVTWDASNRNATPSAGSPLIGAGDPTYSVTEDINGATRSGPLDAGALD
jgi:hypothetical protein